MYYLNNFLKSSLAIEEIQTKIQSICVKITKANTCAYVISKYPREISIFQLCILNFYFFFGNTLFTRKHTFLKKTRKLTGKPRFPARPGGPTGPREP